MMLSGFVIAVTAIISCSFVSPVDGFGTVRSNSVTYKPYSLPCGYHVSWVGSVSMLPVLRADCLIRGSFDGGGVYAKTVVNALIMNMTKYTLIRPDFEEGGNVTVFYGSSNNACTYGYISPEKVKQDLMSDLHVLYQEEVFDSVRDGEFEGTKCKVYERKTEDGFERYYAGDESVLLAIELNATSISTMTSFTYEFEAPLSAFTLDRKIFPSCDERAYEEPNATSDRCKDGQSSSSDASTIRAVAILILVCVLFALI